LAVKRRKWWRAALIVIAMLLIWTFVICFPNPYIFIRNGIRYVRPPVDPSIIQLIEEEIPEEPVEMEKFVLALIQYKYDWENYGMPDYVATARQAVSKRRGDCEDRAIVLASLFEAKNMPYDLKASLVHYWIEYPGKKPNRGENEKVAFVGKVDGKYKIKLPDLGQWRRYMRAGRKGLWDAMPNYRKVLMISGWALILLSIYPLAMGLPRRSPASMQDMDQVDEDVENVK